MIHTRIKLLRYIALSAGILAMMLRSLLYATAIDQKGLLTAGHWAIWTILILTGLVLAGLYLATRRIQSPAECPHRFPHAFLQGGSCLLVAWVIFQRSLTLRVIAADRLSLIAALSGFVAVLALLIVGICRIVGKKSFFLCHCAVSVFFALQLVSQYRNWSADPQLMDYCFYLAAFICLMFTAYFLAGHDADMGKHRALVFFSLLTTYFCCLALPESEDAPLLISCALWAFTCVPQIQTRQTCQEESNHDDP